MIGMSLVGILFVVAWALGNVGLPKSKVKHVPFKHKHRKR
jgi:hypothetical protein